MVTIEIKHTCYTNLDNWDMKKNIKIYRCLLCNKIVKKEVHIILEYKVN